MRFVRRPFSLLAAIFALGTPAGVSASDGCCETVMLTAQPCGQVMKTVVSGDRLASTDVNADQCRMDHVGVRPATQQIDTQVQALVLAAPLNAGPVLGQAPGFVSGADPPRLAPPPEIWLTTERLLL